MNVREAYKMWSEQYDTNENKTKDLEAISLRKNLKAQHFTHCLEIGCGTGKNTEFLMEISDQVIAVDFSAEMLAKAKQKINSHHVKFIQGDINTEWNFTGNTKYDLVTFGLVLEHIKFGYDLPKTKRSRQFKRNYLHW